MGKYHSEPEWADKEYAESEKEGRASGLPGYEGSKIVK